MVKKQTNETSGISTESYKGVRDFYPEDMRVQKYIFEKMREVTESFGYEEYNASILEPAELYEAKSGEEIVNEQTYTFTDRGGRKVTLRPEMTPTVARMIASRSKSMALPARWYAIPNLFRYEQPQKGRLREHFQLNVDIFGTEGVEADIEIISLASTLMSSFGAKNSDYVIKVNNRKVVEALYKHYGVSEEDSYKLSKLIDKKNKISPETFDKGIELILKEKSAEFKAVLSSNKEIIQTVGETHEGVIELAKVVESLNALGISNVIFDQTLMRGFDYYTGIIFEIFDTNPDNMRSLFGGGRFDDLTTLFGGKKIPAVGFGAGDVTLKDFLELHNLLPVFNTRAHVYIARPDKTPVLEAMKIASLLRKEGLETIVELEDKKIGDQIKRAEKAGVSHVLFVGEEEIKTQIFSLKNLSSKEEVKKTLSEIKEYILSK
ncbi:MAG: histidyl-tRNA synthetase, histidyl-tRNA synthetase [Candidatus Parcubacteria bacterium]|jgi:histidyl-tRNA synthetase